jgi:DNA helicase HerA-like ATPase
VYQVTIGEDSDYKKRFVGIVTDYSTIERIKFIYNSKIEIKEGNLLELKIGSRKVLYQIVQGQTKVEALELKNEIGFIVGEAIQLGEWNREKGCFDTYGWVPSINTPVFIANDVDSVDISSDEICIGSIPSTNYSIVMNKELAVTHHTAILGVTGTGKSVFSRNLIKQITCETTKVIVVDLTGEYCKKISSIKQIISSDTSRSIFPKIEIVLKEMAEFRNRRDMGLISSNEKEIKDLIKHEISSFINGSENIGLFDIPEISNSSGNIEYTKYFFSVLFGMAKDNLLGQKRVCVVLEEAHTVIPETSMLAVSDNASKASVNTIAQIALQGRKYNIGFIVIAQRTANVSKTILTQCNSLVVFKELDNTSCDFLSNYMSQDHVRMLSSLKSRQAIAVGKAFRSTTPLVFEVPELDA